MSSRTSPACLDCGSGSASISGMFRDRSARSPYGVCYNTDETGFNYIAGVEVADVSLLPKEYAQVRVAQQHYAVFTHGEHVSTVRATFMAIFNDWLPKSGYQAADAPVFERYDQRFDARTGMGGFEIWVPIKH